MPTSSAVTCAKTTSNGSFFFTYCQPLFIETAIKKNRSEWRNGISSLKKTAEIFEFYSKEMQELDNIFSALITSNEKARTLKEEIFHIRNQPQQMSGLISGKTDVVVGSTSDTLERAKSVGFSSPYFVFKFQVFSKSGSNINSFDDLKDVKVGAALGTTYETEYLAYAKAQGWGDSNYTAFKSENDAFLGLYQGKVDAIISTNTNIATKLQTAEFKDYAAGPFVPNYDDVVGLIAKRSELAWINYLNLFLVHQIRDGKLNEHYNQHFGSDAPADLIQSLRDNK